MKGSTLTAWIAVGDETGQWDIFEQRFSGSANGLAWLLGSAEAWDRALAMPLGGRTALEVFSNPIAQHLPVGTKLSEKTSPHYHLLDFWNVDPRRPAMDVLLGDLGRNPRPVQQRIVGPGADAVLYLMLVAGSD